MNILKVFLFKVDNVFRNILQPFKLNLYNDTNLFKILGFFLLFLWVYILVICSYRSINYYFKLPKLSV